MINNYIVKREILYNNFNNNNNYKSFRKYVSNIPGKYEVKESQKTATYFGNN